MSIINSEAILLKKTELRETSLILDFYTRESGKIKGVIKGIRNPMPQFGAAYEAFTLNKIVFYERKNRDMFIISQCEIIDHFPDLRKSLEKIGYAYYYTELINLTVEPNQKNEEIFDLLLDTLNFLSTPASVKRITRVFEIKLLKALGIMPRLKKCINCGVDIQDNKARFSVKDGGMLCVNCFKIDSASKAILKGALNFISCVADTPMERIPRIKVSKDVGREVENVLRNFLDFHVSRKFKTVGFMKEVGVL